MGIYQRRVKSSTLIEVIVSMLIASIVFFMVFQIILNITSHSRMFTKSILLIRAQNAMDQERNFYKKEGSAVGFNDSLCVVDIKIVDYKGLPNLKLVEVTAADVSGISKVLVRSVLRNEKD